VLERRRQFLLGALGVEVRRCDARDAIVERIIRTRQDAAAFEDVRERTLLDVEIRLGAQPLCHCGPRESFTCK
jgi:hypothetical protein